MTSTATFSSGALKAPPVSRMVRAKDLALDHEFWQNPRSDTGLDDKEIGDLAADIRVRGVQVPLIVLMVKNASGGFTNLVLEGQRRTLAAHLIDPNTMVPVVDKSAEPIELTWEISDRLLLDMLAVGTKRAGLSDFELSEVCERMRNREKTLEDIAGAVGKSESWVSKILTARRNATPQLLMKWRKGQLTTEQFKNLATVKDPEEQKTQANKVVEAAKSGNKGDARAVAKEAEIRAKESAPAPAKVKPAPVVAGPQMPLLPEDKDKAPDPKPARKPGPSRAQLEDMVAMAAKRPPTSELVRGIILGLRFATGEIEPDAFGKAWTSYIDRVQGVTAKRPAKAAKKSAAPTKRAASKASKKSAGKKSKKSKR